MPTARRCRTVKRMSLDLSFFRRAGGYRPAFLAPNMTVKFMADMRQTMLIPISSRRRGSTV
jgi:hypothetical protein